MKNSYCVPIKKGDAQVSDQADVADSGVGGGLLFSGGGVVVVLGGGGCCSLGGGGVVEYVHDHPCRCFRCSCQDFCPLLLPAITPRR